MEGGFDEETRKGTERDGESRECEDKLLSTHVRTHAYSHMLICLRVSTHWIQGERQDMVDK